MTNEERGGLTAVLGDRGEAAKYKLDSARVEKVDGRNVLVVSGSYLGSDRRETAMYIDSDGKGSTIQVIALQSPGGDFAKYEPQYKAMIQRLVWNPYGR